MMIDWPDITFPPINLYNYPKTMNKQERYVEFSYKLTQLINESGLEDLSNTPDYILAEHLVTCLKAFNESLTKRNLYYTKEE